MIYVEASLSALDEQVLDQIQRLREDLRFHLATPRRWYGTLSRVMMARAVQASTSIEGYHSTVDETAAIIDGEEPAGVDEATRKAVAGYRDAMTYVLQLTGPEAPEAPTMDRSLLGALHFMMVGHDLSTHPGQWRPGAVRVRDGAGNRVYEAPERGTLEQLIDELLGQIDESTTPPMIAAAMAHLNLTLIHPFSDGNGRMARCLQTFVLASADRGIPPVFSSIEEYLGHNTGAYYGALTETAAGSWSPQRSTRPWIEFCLTAHYRQAATLRRRIDTIEALWDLCEQAVSNHRLPDRAVGPLAEVARGRRLNRSLYIRIVESSGGEPISEAMATRDLAAMTGAGLLEPIGEKRGRRYLAAESLQAMRRQIRDTQPAGAVIDPYRTASTQR